MKVTDVKTFLVYPGGGKNWLLVKVETDEGISGWGEAYTQADRDKSIEVNVHQMKRYLVGRDPFAIKHFTHVMYTDYAGKRGAMEFYCALSGIEHALWDICGQATGQLSHDRPFGAVAVAATPEHDDDAPAARSGARRRQCLLESAGRVGVINNDREWRDAITADALETAGHANHRRQTARDLVACQPAACPPLFQLLLAQEHGLDADAGHRLLDHLRPTDGGGRRLATRHVGGQGIAVDEPGLLLDADPVAGADDRVLRGRPGRVAAWRHPEP